MTREEVLSLGLEKIDNYKCIIAQLPTSFGKSKFAITLTNKICTNNPNTSILILVPTRFLKEEWNKEINKWGGIKGSYIIECYSSLHKYKHSNFDIVICDETQHLSDNRKEYLSTININKNIICLSATLPKGIYEWLKYKYNSFNIKETIQSAINTEVLPDPTIYLIPLTLNNTDYTETIIKNKNKGLPVIRCNYILRWNYLKKKNIELHIKCTKRQYLLELNAEIEWYKNKTMRGAGWAKTKWLKLCSDRLKFLANCKNDVILSLLDKLKKERVLTFCASIEQSEILGKNCIHSKSKDSIDILNKFNNKKIKHITACNMLNEGTNLKECRVGLFANLNASDIMVIQRIGRILRHKKPIIIIPYYKNTREEELIKKHLNGYNNELINIINDINSIKL